MFTLTIRMSASEFTRFEPIDYHVWGEMMTRYSSLNPKPTDIDQLKEALQNIWNELPQASINKAIRSFRQRLQLCIAAEGGHFEQLLV